MNSPLSNRQHQPSPNLSELHERLDRIDECERTALESATDVGFSAVNAEWLAELSRDRAAVTDALTTTLAKQHANLLDAFASGKPDDSDDLRWVNFDDGEEPWYLR
jgi:hypothetical protein